MLVETGWADHWRTERLPFPTGGAAAQLRDRRAALVGIDSLNIDDMDDRARPAHATLLGDGIPVVEHLTGLDRLPDSGFAFFAAPAPVVGCGTFPVRAFAMFGG